MLLKDDINKLAQLKQEEDKTLLNKSTYLNHDDFLIRMLYKDSY